MNNDNATPDKSTKVYKDRIRFKIYDYNEYLKYSLSDQPNHNLPMKTSNTLVYKNGEYKNVL